MRSSPSRNTSSGGEADDGVASPRWLLTAPGSAASMAVRWTEPSLCGAAGDRGAGLGIAPGETRLRDARLACAALRAASAKLVGTGRAGRLARRLDRRHERDGDGHAADAAITVRAFVAVHLALRARRARLVAGGGSPGRGLATEARARGARRASARHVSGVAGQAAIGRGATRPACFRARGFAGCGVSRGAAVVRRIVFHEGLRVVCTAPHARPEAMAVRIADLGSDGRGARTSARRLLAGNASAGACRRVGGRLGTEVATRASAATAQRPKSQDQEKRDRIRSDETTGEHGRVSRREMEPSHAIGR